MDSNIHVKQFLGTKLVPSWFEQYNRDYLRLIRALRLDAYEKDIEETLRTSEYILTALFRYFFQRCFVVWIELLFYTYYRVQPLLDVLKAVPFENKGLLPFETLNWEAVIFWRVLVGHLRKGDHFEDALGAVLPELVYFCDYIEE